MILRHTTFPALLLLISLCLPSEAEARKRKRRPCAKVLRKYNALLKKASALRAKAKSSEAPAEQSKLYLEAAEAFLKAHTMCSDVERIEYGIARMYHKAGQCEPALRWYTQFLGHQGDEAVLTEDPNIEALFPKAKSHFEDIELQCLGAELKVECATPGTKLVIGERQGLSCPTSLRVLKGTYPVRATVEGVAPWTQEVTLEAGDERVVAVPVLEPPPPPEPPPSGPPWVPIGGAVAGVGVVLSVVGLVWHDNLRLRAQSRLLTAPQVRSEEATINVVFGLGLGLTVLGAAGLGYGLFWAEPEAPSDPSVSLRLGLDGVRVQGRF